MGKTMTAGKKTPQKNSLSRRIGRHLTAGRIFIGGSLLITLLIFGVIALNSAAHQTPPIDRSLPDSSEIIPALESPHLRQGEHPSPYNSNPPTSGMHNPQPPNWGIYGETLPDEIVIHGLEHGGIWISYRDKDPETIRQLEDIARRYSSHMILTYRPADDSLIAVAAWGRLLKLDKFDSGQIYNFIARYRFKGPENV